VLCLALTGDVAQTPFPPTSAPPDLLPTVIWLVRGSVCGAVGILLLIAHPTHRVLIGVAFALGTIGVATWFTLRTCPALHGRREHLLPWVSALIALAGSPAVITNATALVGFSILAGICAGEELSWLLGLSVLATGALALVIIAVTTQADPFRAIGLPLLAATGYIVGIYRRSYTIQARQAQRLLQQSERLRAEQRRVAVLDERTRIAREIHDVLAHSLGALGIQIRTVRAVLAADDTPQATALLAQAQQLATDGLAETRRAIGALRGDAGPLDEQLTRIAETHRVRHDVRVQVAIDGRLDDLDPDITVALIRIAQETLVNAAKHAPRQPVDIRLVCGADSMRLTVTNPLAEPGHRDGSKLPPLAGMNGGYGLSGMRERLQLFNGTLQVGSVDGSWTVVAELPR
jgi:signal transduction histidine kinase